jgi:hypothetical protein
VGTSADEDHPYRSWSRRITFNPRLRAPLGFAVELWRGDQDLPGYAAWTKAPTLGPPSLELGYETIEEAIAAAGQAERRLFVLRSKFNEGQGIVDHEIRPGRDPSDWDAPIYGSGVGLSQFSEAYDAWIDFLWWIRAFEERLDRPPRPPDTKRRRGLLNALAPGPLADDLMSDLNDLRAGVLLDVRFFANYTLHHRILPSPGRASARITGDGLWLPIPDPVTGPIDTHGQLRYEQDRDAVTHANNVFGAVSKYVDGLLAKLEDETIRVRPDLARETG